MQLGFLLDVNNTKKRQQLSLLLKFLSMDNNKAHTTTKSSRQKVIEREI